jgi:hypothetical protein
VGSGDGDVADGDAAVEQTRTGEEMQMEMKSCR